MRGRGVDHVIPRLYYLICFCDWTSSVEIGRYLNPI